MGHFHDYWRKELDCMVVGITLLGRQTFTNSVAGHVACCVGSCNSATTKCEL